MSIVISAPKKEQIPIPNIGGGRGLGPIASALSDLDVGFMCEIEGATFAQVSSAATAQGKRESKKFTVRKLNKVVEGQPVFGVWRLK